MRIILIIAALITNFLAYQLVLTSMNLFGNELVYDNLLQRLIVFLIGVCILICSFTTLGMSDEM